MLQVRERAGTTWGRRRRELLYTEGWPGRRTFVFALTGTALDDFIF